jgi:hypothetical protein
MKLNYHNYFLNLIRKSSKAKFVSFVRYKNNYILEVRGDKFNETFSLEGTPNDVTPDRYMEVISYIQEKHGK